VKTVFIDGHELGKQLVFKVYNISAIPPQFACLKSPLLSLRRDGKQPAAAPDGGRRKRPSKWLARIPARRVTAVLAALAAPLCVSAQEGIIRDETVEQVRIYKTPEERREAGLKYELSDWLAVSGLVEFEYLYQRSRLFDASGHTSGDEFSKTLQADLELTPWSWVKGELLYEYDDEANRHTLDEAYAAFEAGHFELAIGKQYVPFGVYYSHFVSGPILEFGETRDRGMTLSYGSDERLDVSAFVYQGRAEDTGSDGDSLDWGFAVEGSPNEFGSFGISYLSDLADSKEGFLRDSDDRYENGVSGLSANVIAGFDPFEVTAEFVRALGTFRELEPDRNRPRAWNVELAYYPRNDFEWSLRLEGSNEVEDAPHLRGGAAVSWRFLKKASLTLEYLRATFKRGLAEDSGDRELHKAHQFGGQVTIDF